MKIKKQALEAGKNPGSFLRTVAPPLVDLQELTRKSDGYKERNSRIENEVEGALKKYASPLILQDICGNGIRITRN